MTFGKVKGATTKPKPIGGSRLNVAKGETRLEKYIKEGSKTK